MNEQKVLFFPRNSFLAIFDKFDVTAPTKTLLPVYRRYFELIPLALAVTFKTIRIHLRRTFLSVRLHRYPPFSNLIRSYLPQNLRAMTIEMIDHHPENLNDDTSIATAVTNNEAKTIITPNLQSKEFTLRFRFSPNSDNANNLVARNHYDLLHLMQTNIKDIEIFDNNGNSLNFRKQMKSFQEHATRFKLHYLKGNQNKN